MNDWRSLAAYIRSAVYELPWRTMRMKKVWMWGWNYESFCVKILLDSRIWVFKDLKFFITAENHRMMKCFVKKRELSALVFTGFHWNQNNSKNFITPSARSLAESSFIGIFSILIMNHHEYSRTQIDMNHSAVSNRHSLHLIKHWNDHEWSCARYPTEPIHQLRF